jgi:uncharacterized caspase-like protein/lipoprotein NlpI
MKKRAFAALFLCLLAIPATVFSQTYTKRLALVIGNSAYQNGGALKNPVNDARSVASALQNMGFEVIRHENVSQTQLKQAINAFGQKLREYEVGLFYYAGHGIQYKGSNYMIPVEADLQAAEQIEFDCVAADRVLAYMESAATKVNIIIMDACRNNPFERSWNRSANGNGLAMMNAPTGTLIAYATAPGRVASDGESANGLYTSILLKYMNDPALNLEQVFKRVRTEVTEKSGGAQVPWETTSLTGGDFFLTSKKAEAVAKQEPTTYSNEGRELASTEDPAKALQFYTSAQNKYDQNLYNEAIADYTKAIQYNPLDMQAYLWRGHSKYNLGYDNKVTNPKMLESAIEDYSKAIQLSPGEFEAYYYRANAKKLLKRYNEAIPDFTLAIRYNPKSYDAYYFRGLTYYLMEKYGAGVEDFSKVLEMSPEYKMAFYWRGMCKYAMEDYAGSIEEYNSVLQLDPNYIDALVYRADAYYGLQEYQTAIENYKKALAVDPNAIDAVMYIGHSYYSLKNHAEAIVQYNAALKINPQYADAFYWKSRAYLYGLNDKAKALTEIKKALAIAPDDQTYQTYFSENFN